jgi:hypothetical protein
MNKILKKIKKSISKIFSHNEIQDIRELILTNQNYNNQKNTENPLNHYGLKCFSQSDEDGITIEIIKRINIYNGTYAEYGVGNGTENNTLILAALGWSGFWIGGENLLFRHEKLSKFKYFKTWITKENAFEYYSRGLDSIKKKGVDLLSIDLDGNDYYILEELLKKGIEPKIIISEYNAKFPPPILFKIKYNPSHYWKSDDYFGASLSTLSFLLNKYNYFLVCCNSHTGANTFFIHKNYQDKFRDLPTDIRKIYMPPKYYLNSKYGHPISIETIEHIFNESESQ